MLCYTVYDIMKTVIEFLHDPNTGQQQVLDFIRQLKLEAEKEQDTGKLQLFAFIIRGLEFLELHGVTHAFKNYFQTHREDGRPYTIMLLKELRDHVPLLEFRVNWKGSGAFRAVFFEWEYEGMQVLCFTRAVIKQTTFDDDFERIANEAESVYADFTANPEKYIKIGVEEHE
ncbi:hypothetical protein [Paenibacillus agilis]|uniref:Uncharacterized protein n=1 Tax=Paenibacillus agilis TaxID=3020863 RepID=A0A559ICZ0_9BACL|nr:hypothetical protein [Paenibacillus agilis]TVX85537.1 hypothetical protein FPZ44_24580 [Paenibacillus agilis]